MKTLFITLVSFIIGQAAFGQSDKYQKAMEKNVAQFDSVRTTPTLLTLMNNFERIGSVEKSQWLPYYYAGMCAMNLANQEKDKNQVDSWADKADAFAIKADSLSPKNSEISCLRATIHFARINVDFMSRGPKYSALGGEALQQALTQNPNNPRAMVVLAQLKWSAPEGYGGDKAMSCQLAARATQLFAQNIPNTIEPHWGQSSAQQIMKKCEGQTAQK
ncbi:tetratricopeptide repeat protein [Spirosoma soli]|uniref:Tetratricopeptide repeat protein n=1 Tax=Spirosoma soli TaxID=1770529 RepID=A0ABW5MAE0_9BACT